MNTMNLFGGNDKSSKALFGDNDKSKELATTPIQDEEGNLTFELEDREYSLNVNSEEERRRVLAEVNANSLAKYNWFKENTGEKHWVLYNTEMYEITKNGNCKRLYLHYKEDSNLAPVTPINMTSCYCMFVGCSKLIQLDLSDFDTRNVIDMRSMFEDCLSLITIYISNKWSTDRVTYARNMFKECCSLPGFSPEKTDIKMAKPTEQEGYLTLKK